MMSCTAYVFERGNSFYLIKYISCLFQVFYIFYSGIYYKIMVNGNDYMRLMMQFNMNLVLRKLIFQ